MSSITLLVFITACPFLVAADIQYMPWPEHLFSCLESFQKVTDITEEVGEHIFRHCIDVQNIKSSKLSWSWVNITGVGGLPRTKRQATTPITSPPSGYRIRKEYRTLTDDERNRFHAALNAMRRAGEFQIFANYHRNIPGRNVLQEFHNGPAFLGWHRVYLARFEEALRRYDNTVSLPYWNSSMDFYMTGDPANSVLWSNLFLGTRSGFVTSGPFAGWPGGANSVLNRDVMLNRRGLLISTDDINNVLRLCRTEDVSFPPRRPLNSIIEFHHNRPHSFVGGNTGDMGTLPNAAFDPAFFLHHAYIDYIWELFRTRQRSACNVDPTTDYPNTVSIQGPNSFMWGNDLSAYRNIDGYADYWTRNWYGYQPTPTCSSVNPDCGSRYLRCDTTRNTCVSRSASEVLPSTGKRRKRQAIAPFSDVNAIYDNAYTPKQNVYSVDGVCDTKLWVYIPVQIVHIRPKGYTFTSFPITAGQLDASFDVYYSPTESYLYNYSQPGNPKEYQQCQKYESGAKPIYVTSDGISYYGTYTDYAIVDGRLPVQSSVVYIAVKKPSGTSTEAILSARDICGCVCKPQCLVRNSNPPAYKPCSGAIKLTDSSTNMYASTIYEATMMEWDIAFGNIRSKKPDAAIVFTCTFGNEWPWINYQTTLNEDQTRGHHVRTPGGLPTRYR
ncbi:hypothetical protein ACJMK2_010919 [Sinanodonta woodiana]|uniref:Tyrosinase copper-binding domain-containing protein n=1 Tax=Sinanodonta woodiana TaxID=1069815 RepID=A0ABD3VH04_SINWO